MSGNENGEGPDVEALEKHCRLLASSAGALIGAATVNAATYVVLVYPNVGGMTFATNAEGSTLGDLLRRAADVFDKEMARPDIQIVPPMKGLDP